MWYACGIASTKTRQISLRERAAKRRVRRDLRRQAKLMAQHPENDAIDAWTEAAYDWSEWK
jgi:hypothetical protein